MGDSWKPKDVIIKHRLFTWFENGDSPAMPGETVRLERINHLGDQVTITDELSYNRGVELGSFFSDADAKAIKAGTYTGPAAQALEIQTGMRQAPESVVQPLEDEGSQIGNLDAQAIGEYINANKLTVDETVALATAGDTDSIQKIYDAELHVAQLREADPRKGVTDALDAMLQAAASG